MELESATFACGCFWSKEYHFSRVNGVVATRVGYTGGHTEAPTYEQVCCKTTGHAEAVEITFNPKQVSFDALLQVFFKLHDSTHDRRANGGQYRSAIFYLTENQRLAAESALANLRAAGIAAATTLESTGPFWPAEARHQGWCERTGIVPGQRRSS